MSRINGIFQVTTPKIYTNSDVAEDEVIKKVTDLFDKYNICWHTCDTIAGSFSLNQEWIEMVNEIEMDVEWDKVEAVNWTKEDIDMFTELAFSGKIIVRVYEVKDGKYILNN